MAQTSRWCNNCHRYTLHAKPRFSVFWGLVLTFLTFGLWLLVWVPLILVETAKPWHCQMCGCSKLL